MPRSRETSDTVEFSGNFPVDVNPRKVEQLRTSIRRGIIKFAMEGIARARRRRPPPPPDPADNATAFYETLGETGSGRDWTANKFSNRRAPSLLAAKSDPAPGIKRGVLRPSLLNPPPRDFLPD